MITPEDLFQKVKKTPENLFEKFKKRGKRDLEKFEKNHTEEENRLARIGFAESMKDLRSAIFQAHRLGRRDMDWNDVVIIKRNHAKAIFKDIEKITHLKQDKNTLAYWYEFGGEQYNATKQKYIPKGMGEKP